MSLWIILQVAVNFILFAGVVFLLIQRKQLNKEDHRFSKGLQLLQSKIAILEDLSDQTDSQVKTLTKLLEDKYKEIQAILIETDSQILRMEEVAENTWKQIQASGAQVNTAEQQNLSKYVKAAQMANSGKLVDEILKAVDLTRGEVELIFAMNKDQLVFNQNSLPAWIKSEVKATFKEPEMATPSRVEAPPATNTPKMSIPDVATIQQNGKTLSVRPMNFKKIEV